MEEHCGRAMSNRSVGSPLQRLREVRGRERTRTPPLTEPRKTHIPRILIEMKDALAQEEEGRATVVYMDESLVHQMHSSA